MHACGGYAKSLSYGARVYDHAFSCDASKNIENDEVATWANIFLGRTRPFIQKCILCPRILFKEVYKEMVKANAV